MSYVPASRCVTGFPDESRREIVKESFLPTVATSLGLSARARVEGETRLQPRLRAGFVWSCPDSTGGPPFRFVRRKAAGSPAERQTDQHQHQRDEGRAPEVDSRERQRALPDRSRRCEDARRGRHRPRCLLVTFVTETMPLITTVPAGATAGLSEGPEVVPLRPGPCSSPGPDSSRVRSHDRVRSRMRRRRCVPAASPACPFNACTSTSCPPAQGQALCGWLLPGPCSTVLGPAPFRCAISPGRLAVAVELRFVGRRSRVRVVRRRRSTASRPTEQSPPAVLASA